VVVLALDVEGDGVDPLAVVLRFRRKRAALVWTVVVRVVGGGDAVVQSNAGARSDGPLGGGVRGGEEGEEEEEPGEVRGEEEEQEWDGEIFHVTVISSFFLVVGAFSRLQLRRKPDSGPESGVLRTEREKN
jgi:hypothetical protein